MELVSNENVGGMGGKFLICKICVNGHLMITTDFDQRPGFHTVYLYDSMNVRSILFWDSEN